MKNLSPFLIFLVFSLIPSTCLSTDSANATHDSDEETCLEGNCENGVGTWIYREGKKYVGQFQNGVPHGKGQLTLPNGMKVIGQFENGVPHGRATTIYPNGETTVEIIWDKGEMVRIVEEKVDETNNNKTDVTDASKPTDTTDETDVDNELTASKDGKCIQGDCLNGYGIMIFPNGKKYVGKFKDKMKYGRGVEGYEGGDGKFGYWMFDIYVGKEKPEELRETISGSIY